MLTLAYTVIRIDMPAAFRRDDGDRRKERIVTYVLHCLALDS